MIVTVKDFVSSFNNSDDFVYRVNLNESWEEALPIDREDLLRVYGDFDFDAFRVYDSLKYKEKNYCDIYCSGHLPTLTPSSDDIIIADVMLKYINVWYRERWEVRDFNELVMYEDTAKEQGATDIRYISFSFKE